MTYIHKLIQDTIRDFEKDAMPKRIEMNRVTYRRLEESLGLGTQTDHSLDYLASNGRPVNFYAGLPVYLDNAVVDERIVMK